MKLLSKILSLLFDLLFPKLCLGCFEPGSFVCKKCFSGLKMSSEIIEISFIEKVFICCEPSQLLRNIIHEFKYHSNEVLADYLCFLFKIRIQGLSILQDCTAVPVPLHQRRFNERGFNQSLLLAQGFILPCNDVLKRIRFTKPQAQLNRKERLKNVTGAFEIRTGCKAPKKILLIDDVCTTGSTLKECAAILRKNGAKEIYALTLTHGM